jgi:hypothetical protein
VSTARRAISVVALAALAAGCGEDPAARLRALGSWAATSAMLGRAWSEHETPRAYTLRALGRARREIGQARRDLTVAPAVPLVSHVEAATRELEAAVGADDRRAARAVAERLADDARALADLAVRSAS